MEKKSRLKRLHRQPLAATKNNDTNQNTKIAAFFGNFDPITNSDIRIIKKIINSVDKLIRIVTDRKMLEGVNKNNTICNLDKKQSGYCIDEK